MPSVSFGLPRCAVQVASHTFHPTAMTAELDPPAALLDRLEAGFQSDAQHVKTLAAELEEALADIRQFGQRHHPSLQWTEHWQALEPLLQRVQRLARQMDEAIENDDRARMRQALESREAFQADDEKLVNELRLIRDQLADADATGRAEWNALAQTVEDVLNAIHGCVRVLCLKLELTEGRSSEQVRDFVKDVRRQLREHPCPPNVDPQAYELEYLKASIELDHEKHEALGFPTNIKTLFTWFETPEERVQRNLGFPVD